ncbi:MAG: lactate utilization protein [Gammaproteobacteria bacterium]|nr:lactate utilization protein [Gammaproteobacteria bacterium]
MDVKTADFRQRARAALAQPTLQRSLQGMRRAMPALRSAALAALPDHAALRDRARESRDHALAHLGHYLVAFESRVRAAGGEVHWARTGAEAGAIVAGLCERAGARRVIKSKSMVTEEIGLNATLAARGLQVTETDLGEYIIQLRGESPSHILAPALHVSLAEVGAAFERHHRRSRTAPLTEAGAMLVEAREELRAVFRAADVGITGANFLVAETGAAVLVTNEGNADLVASLPATHIVVTGIEKVVATLDDLGVLLRLLARSAIGEPLSSYTTLVHGPRRATEAAGPAAFHVVLVDDGRSALLGTPRQEILRCIRCSACLNHCPVYTAVGGHAYGSVYSGPMGAVLAPAIDGLATTAQLPAASTLCGRCEAVCPVAIPLPRLLRDWRGEALRAGFTTPAWRRSLRLWQWLAAHPVLYRFVLGLAAGGLRLVSVPARRGERRIRRLPLVARGWFAVRDLPAPEGGSFQARWRARQP